MKEKIVLIYRVSEKGYRFLRRDDWQESQLFKTKDGAERAKTKDTLKFTS